MTEELNLHLKFLLNHMALPVISALIHFNIPEKLLEGPKSTEELSENTDIQPEKLFRYLRLVSHFGIFKYDSASNKWSNTNDSALLATQASKSIWGWNGNMFNMEMYAHTIPQLTSSKDPMETLERPKFFERLIQNPDQLGFFQSSMTVISKSNSKEIIDGIDLSGCLKTLDVGGADGTLAIGLSKRNSEIEFGVFDRPELEILAKNNIENSNVSARVKFISGDFFEYLPEGYDCIIMKHIIHDWADMESIAILKNCRKVLNVGNKLFIVEHLIDHESEYYMNTICIDQIMLMCLGGKERTREQFKKLFDAAGFEIASIKSAVFQVVIECRAV